MQKTKIVLFGMGLLCLVFFVKVKAESFSGKNNKNGAENVTLSLDRQMDSIYDQIDFKEGQALSKNVFRKAYTGYLNLKAKGLLRVDENLLSIADFSLSANDKRLWVIDLVNHTVLFHTLVAHGQGTGEEFAHRFSNRENSHESSLGFYITENTYTGNNGYSLRLKGMDKGYNDHAYGRAIVMHGADYVSQAFIKNNERLGRSWGCPAVPVVLAKSIINTIKDSTCLFIYYPDKNYLAASTWLQKASVPGNFLQELHHRDTTAQNVLLAEKAVSNGRSVEAEAL